MSQTGKLSDQLISTTGAKCTDRVNTAEAASAKQPHDLASNTEDKPEHGGRDRSDANVKTRLEHRRERTNAAEVTGGPPTHELVSNADEKPAP